MEKNGFLLKVESKGASSSGVVSFSSTNVEGGNVFKVEAKEMASGNVTFAATGVSEGYMLNGVALYPGGAMTHSMVMRSHTGTFRFVEGHHKFQKLDN